MGNSISQEDLEKLPKIFDKIMEIPCPKLDIGNTIGHTGYIDFIKPEEVKGAIMKGIDHYSRRFIVWKAQVDIYKPDGSSNSYDTFTIFFKRYPEQTSRTYHTCGHHGRNLIGTEGGTNLKQIEFLYEFLSKGYIEIDDLQANDIRLSYPNQYDNNGDIIKTDLVFKIKLVESF